MDLTSEYVPNLFAPNVSKHLNVIDAGDRFPSVGPCQYDVGRKKKLKITDVPSDLDGSSLVLGGYSANKNEESSVDIGLSINLSLNGNRRVEKRNKYSDKPSTLVLERSEPHLELSLSTCPSESNITSITQASIRFQESATQQPVGEGTISSRWKLWPLLPPLQNTEMTTIPSLVPSNHITGPTATAPLNNSLACVSDVANQQQCPKSRAKQCQFIGCTKGSRSPTKFCIGHGGGKRCQKSGCNKGAEGKTMFCKGHGGGRRCHYIGCTKSAEGSTDYCINHGGGLRCTHEGCSHGARGRSGFCITHGGGKRCKIENCNKSGEGIASLCIAHGGGRRCQYIDCTKGAQGSTKLCKAHGGGKRCTFAAGCTKGAEGSTLLCKGHGGGKRCTFEGGCTKSVHGGSLFCVKHGGGKRCAKAECTKSARGKTNFCVSHGGGKRCKYREGCDKSAQGSTDFCRRHGGGRRCSWAQSGLGGQTAAAATCNKVPKGKLGLCASHASQVENLRMHGGKNAISRANTAAETGQTSKASLGYFGSKHIHLQIPLSDTNLVESCGPSSQYSLPEGRVHGGRLMAMMLGDGTNVGSSKLR